MPGPEVPKLGDAVVISSKDVPRCWAVPFTRNARCPEQICDDEQQKGERADPARGGRRVTIGPAFPPGATPKKPRHRRAGVFGSLSRHMKPNGFTSPALQCAHQREQNAQHRVTVGHVLSTLPTLLIHIPLCFLELSYLKHQ